MAIGLTLAKPVLEKALYEIFKKSYDTIQCESTEVGDEVSKKFAEVASKKVAEAIYKYISNADVIGTIPVNGQIQFTGTIPSVAIGTFVATPGIFGIL